MVKQSRHPLFYVLPEIYPLALDLGLEEVEGVADYLFNVKGCDPDLESAMFYLMHVQHVVN